MVKKRREFSKSLVTVVTTTFLGVVAFCLVAWVIRGEFPGEILTVTATSWGAIVAAYFGKSGYENSYKIRGSYSYGEQPISIKRGEY
jgi:uncharacterized membrane protein YdjX (TVP38/TMEM64 family)